MEGEGSRIFTKEEKEAMAELIRERRRKGSNKEELEKEVLDKIKSLPQRERQIALTIHKLVLSNSKLYARTWYGMPAYANDDGVVCFFQPASRFKSRYSTFGFTDNAYLDDGEMWATSFAIKEINEKVKQRIIELLKKAMSREQGTSLFP